MRTSRTLAILVVLFAALGLAGTACSAVQSPAMTVNGRVYSQEELWADLAKANPSARTPTEYSTTEIADQLTKNAQEDIIATGLLDLGVEVTDDDRGQARALLEQSQSTSVAEDIAAAQVALARHLGEQAVQRGEASVDDLARQLYEQDKSRLATPGQVCIAGVFVVAGELDPRTGQVAQQPTAAQVDAAKARAAEARAKLVAGTPADQVIADYSDAPADQTKACIGEDQLNEPFASVVTALQPGQVSEVIYVDTQGAAVVIQLESRQAGTPAPDFEQVKDDYLRPAVIQLGFQKLTDWYLEESRTVDVTVNERFGRWDAAQGAVVPPEGAAQPTVPTTAITDLLGGGNVDLSGAGAPGAEATIPDATTPESPSSVR